MHLIRTFGHLVGGTLLVAGTTIGVGMLGLPAATAQGGFIPSVVIYLICWVFMLSTGLLILEACVWMPKESNLITLSLRLLGKGGKTICWILYLFLYTSLMVAHTVTGGDILHQLIGGSPIVTTILYVILFSPIAYLGAHSVDRLNLGLMMGIFMTYLLFVIPALSHVNKAYLSTVEWSKALYALPVVFTAFGYQGLIPTIYNYMERNVAKVRLAIVLGTAIPFILYVIWEASILGIIPMEGPNGLQEIVKKGKNVVNPLGVFLNNPALVKTGRIFAFLAATTSYMGIGIAFLDFLADGLKIQKKGLWKFFLYSLIFVVPLIISLIYPTIFFKALGYAGGIGCVLLLGVMPTAFAWVGRYRLKLQPHAPQLPGGKVLLGFLFAFGALELVIEFIHLISPSH